MLWVLGRLWNWLFHEPFANAAGVFVAGAADVAGAVGASDLLTAGFSADTAGVVAGNPVYGCVGAGGAGITGAGSGISSGAGPRRAVCGIPGPDFVVSGSTIGTTRETFIRRQINSSVCSAAVEFSYCGEGVCCIDVVSGNTGGCE